MKDYSNLIERAEPFMQGLGKAILREIAASFEEQQAKIEHVRRKCRVTEGLVGEYKDERDQARDALRVAVDWINDAVVVLSHVSTAIQGGIGAEAEGVGGCSVAVLKQANEVLE